MPTPSIQKLLVGTLLTLATAVAQAAVIKVDFSYAPNSAPQTVRLTGQFTYDNANIGGDGIVNAVDLKSFSFTLANDTLSVTTDLALLRGQVSAPSFVFTYDPTQQAFAYGAGQQVWYNASAAAPGTALVIGTTRGGGARLDWRLSPIVNGTIQVIVDNENIVSARNKFSYTVTAVPEPETYGMLMLGLGVVGAVVRRRRAA